MSKPERTARQRIAALAALMVEGHADLLAGCRAIVRLREELPEPDASDPDLLAFVAVEAALEEAPLEPEGETWMGDALAGKGRKKPVSLDTVKPELLRACRALVARWVVRPS